MGFSSEWEETYKNNAHLSVWPWSNLVSLTHRYCDLHKGMKVLELGCGAGANVPYFISLGADYYGLEGSKTMVSKLSGQFPKESCHFACVDFTKDFHYKDVLNGGGYDIIIDRGSVTHNATADIQNVIKLSLDYLKPGGKYIGMDWFATDNEFFRSGQYKCKEVDGNTRVFQDGYFAGLGNVHFSDAGHIKELFSGFKLEFLEEKVHRQEFPEPVTWAWWDFVFSKK